MELVSKRFKMSDIKVTVLMTVYNGGNYLRPAIESVLNQTYKDFEFLIINDCSTDNSVDVIESFNDRRIVVHSNEINIGQTKTLNIGFRLAKGEYVARIDADDIAFPNWIEDQVEFLKENPQYDVVSAGVVIINSNNEVKRIYTSPSSADDIILRSIIKSPINHGSSLLRRELILSVGGYDEKYTIGADYALWLKLITIKAKITSNHKFLMSVRRHDESASKQGSSGQDIAERSQIIKEYVNCISGVSLSDSDSTLFCKAHYDEGQISFEKFQKALQIHADIYNSLKTSLNLNSKAVWRWRKKQANTFYYKRIYYFILNNNFNEVRKVSYQAIQAFGLFNLFTVLFLASFLGNVFLKFIPSLHSKIFELKTLFQSGIRVK